jgi:hypothetical protein
VNEVSVEGQPPAVAGPDVAERAYSGVGNAVILLGLVVMEVAWIIGLVDLGLWIA